MDVVVRTFRAAPPGLQEIEVVERKGLGHPDTMCDAIAEYFCVRLCRYYLEHFDTILHHNVDKILLCGGAARTVFGGGEILEPIEIYVAGRATQEYRGKRIPVHEIAVESCRAWLEAHVPALDVDRHVRIVPRLRPGSGDLTWLFGRGAAGPLANDTSCGAGFAPLTDLERVVLDVERTLNAADTKRIHPAIGADIKVMGVRRGSRITLTIGCAFIDRFLRDVSDYAAKKAVAAEIALAAARRVTGADEIDVTVNAGDDLEAGSIYLTVTGTSAEAGDDGEVGRGNRACGLITPYRAMTMEAPAGKNPVSHVGKLYNVEAGRIAALISEQLPVDDVACLLVSQIGRPVTDPQLADVRVAARGRANAAAIEKSVGKIVRAEIGRLDELRMELLEEKVSVY